MITSKTSLLEASQCTLVSFDSTLKANLSVGLPLDVLAYETNSYEPLYQGRIRRDDPYYNAISEGWSTALKTAFQSLPPFHFEE